MSMTNQQGAPEALRLRSYVERRKRAKQLDVNKVHAFDTGCDTEAELLLSDVETLLSLVEAQQPATSAAAFDEHGFRDWALRNLPKGSIIGNGEWWADHLTAWAKRFVKAAPKPSPTAQVDSAPAAICNACGADLLEVKQSPNSYLSAEQFDADKLGDWYCKCCPKGPSEGGSAHRYFWNRDLGAAAPQADSAPAEAVQRIVHLRADRERRVYVAGPMTGLPEYNFPLFNATAARLRSEGWHVENPAEHGHVDGAGWSDYLRWDISRIATCGAIYLLPGWSKSKGATLEVHIAGVLGLQVLLADGAESPTAQPAPAATPQADSQPAPVAAFEVADAIADSQYLAGVSAGWNAANADNPNEALRKLHESRAGYLKPLSAARAPADSALEDAERWEELRAQHEDDAAERCCVFAPNDMRECLVPVGSLPGELDAFIDAQIAARKQGANHD